MKTILKSLGVISLAALLACGSVAQRQRAHLGPDPKAGQVYKGQLSANLPLGTTVDQAKAFAAANGLEYVRQMLVPDRFVFRVQGWQQANATQLTLDKVSALAKLSGVIRPTADLYLTKHDSTPNDPFYPQQWSLTQINANKAWDFQKGKDGILVAFLDDSCLTTHEDLKARVTTGYSAYYQDSLPEHIGPELGWMESHGTMTSSTCAASTNNGVGMSGVAWQGVKIIPIRISDPFSNLIPTLEYDAIQWLINQGATGHPKAQVVNMSYGGVYQKDAQEETLLNQLYTQGSILCASSGNYREFGIPAGWPASDKNVISCAATGPGGTIASYSSQGDGTANHKVDLAAPGGDGYDPSTAMTVCDMDTVNNNPNGSYLHDVDGTSFSCPMIVGACALLLSQGVPSKNVFDILKSSANARGRQVPNIDYGWGEIDIYEALRRFGGSATFLSPNDGGTFEYKKIDIEVLLGNIDPKTVTLFDGTTQLTGFTITPNDPTGKDKVFSTLSLTNVFAVGQHTLTLNGTSVVSGKPLSPSPSITFRIQPHQQASGWAMFTVPYGIGNMAPPELVPGTFALWRFAYSYDNNGVATDAGNWYAYPDRLGSFHPDDPSDPLHSVTKDNSTDDVSPTGIGYFVWLERSAPLVITEPPDLNTAYRIRLRPGWAIFGDPFPFVVDWNLVEVDSLNNRMTMSDAINNEYVMPQIYRYSPTLDTYTWMAAPQGQLYPWEGAWVKCLKPCWLVVHPIPGSGQKATGNGLPDVRGDGWALQIGARAGSKEDSRNFVGATSQPRPQYDRVEKAPVRSPGVTLSITGPDGKQSLAQYLKPTSNRNLDWMAHVTPPSGANSVTLSWSEVISPSSRVNYVLVDTSNGRRLLMNSTSSYTFKTSADGKARTFKISAYPDQGAKLVVTDLEVSSSKGRGPAAYTVRYNLNKGANVTVAILSPTGKRVKVLDAASRAAGLNSTLWTGRDERGISQPPGVYMAEVTAADTNGQQVRVVTPIVLTR